MKRLLLTLAAFFLTSILQAETRNIYNIPFEIDSISEIGDDTFEVTVQGTTRVISASNLNEFIVNSYFKDGKRPSHLSPLDLRKFTHLAFDENNINTSEKALLSVLLDTEVNDETAYRFVDDLITANNKSGTIFKNVIAALPSQPVARNVFLEIVYFIGLIDQLWFSENATKWIREIESPSKEFFQKKFLGLIDPKSLKESYLSIEMLKQSFGENDELYKKLKLVYQKLSDLSKKGDLQQLSLRSFSSDGGIDPTIAEALVEIIHTKAESYLANSKFKEALEVCGQVDQQLRTPKTIALLEQALKGLRIPLREEDFSATSWDLLIELSKTSPTIYNNYRDMLAGQIRYLVEEEQFSRIDSWFSLLLKVNPNPSRINDDLKLKWAHGLITIGQKDEAIKKLNSISTGFDVELLGKKMFLLVSARRERVLLFTLLILISLGIATILCIKKKLIAGKEENEVNEVPMFVKTFSGRESPESREFQECLAILGVSLEASEQEVKATYRKLIKLVHPDKVGNNNPQAADRFMRLQKAYDRIEELNRQFGFLSKEK